jgi:hypothetical protein
LWIPFTSENASITALWQRLVAFRAATRASPFSVSSVTGPKGVVAAADGADLNLRS